MHVSETLNPDNTNIKNDIDFSIRGKPGAPRDRLSTDREGPGDGQATREWLLVLCVCLLVKTKPSPMWFVW